MSFEGQSGSHSEERPPGALETVAWLRGVGTRGLNGNPPEESGRGGCPPLSGLCGPWVGQPFPNLWSSLPSQASSGSQDWSITNNLGEGTK